MAKLFYGVSVSDNSDESKDVIIYNPLEEGIEPGDLLAVYFAYGNTISAPTLVVNGTSTLAGEDSTIPENESTSLSEDAGVFIKTRNVEAEVDYMWQDGEVCLFVLVSQQTNSDIEQGYASPSEPVPSANDTLYYMLVRGARANSEYYGLTKLFTDSFGEDKEYGSFLEWLQAEDEDDTKVAATPYLLKELCNWLIGRLGTIPEPTPTPGPEPSPEPQIQLINYTSEVDDSGILIGTLLIGSNEISVRIPQLAGPENTSQLFNDADIVSNGAGGYIHNRQEGQVVISYELTEDTEVIEGKNYYIKITDDEYQKVVPQSGWEIIANPDPQANPAQEGWYVQSGPGYELSQDTIVQEGKQYYIIEAGAEPRLVTNNDFYVPFEPPEEQTESIDPQSIPLYEYYESPYAGYWPSLDTTYNPEKTYYTLETSPADLTFYEYNSEIVRTPATETSVLDGKVYCVYVSDSPVEQGWYEQNKQTIKAVGTHFITDVVDGSLYLYKPNGTVGVYVANPGTDDNYSVSAPVEGKLLTNALIARNQNINNGVPINTSYVNSGFPTTPLNIYGDRVSFFTNGTNASATLQVDYPMTGGNKHYSTIPFYAPSYMESGQYLKDRYCHALVWKSIRLGQGNTGNGTSNYSIWENGKWVNKGTKKAIYCAKGNTTGHQRVNIRTPGYRPRAIAGWNVSYSNKENGYTPYGAVADASYQCIWELFLTGVSGDTAGIIYDTRNYKPGNAYFIIDVYLLCEKIF